jgi:hypothetical protein
MTQAKGGIAASPTDPTDLAILNVEDPGRLDVTEDRMAVVGVGTGPKALTLDQLAAIKSQVSGGGNGVFGSNDAIAVLAGNSISSYNRYSLPAGTAGSWAQTSELFFARRFAGGCRMRFKRIAENSTALHDAYGNYAHSAAMCEVMTAEWVATGGWFESLAAAGLRPDIVIIPDIIINNIWVNGESATVCIQRLQLAERMLRSEWPGVKIWWWTVRGAAGLNTDAKVAAANGVSDWMVAKDNGTDTFTTDLRGIWGPMNAPALGMTQSDDGTHPSVRGASLNGRVLAKDLKRIFGVPRRAARCITPNPWMIGSSGFASGTSTGTIPTGYSHSGAGTNACVAVATGSSMLLTYTVNAAGTGLGGVGSPQATGLALVADSTNLSGSIHVKIVSGAKYLRGSKFFISVAYSDATSSTHTEMTIQSGGNQANYVDGDEFDIQVPEVFGTAGKTISAVSTGFNAEGTLDQGVGTLVLELSNMGAHLNY